jgi:hypothetical protein
LSCPPMGGGRNYSFPKVVYSILRQNYNQNDTPLLAVSIEPIGTVGGRDTIKVS